MPRKRYIKPGFFKNEELAALKPLVRIFFEGLWCWADREGRLLNRPLRLKSEIMPYDKINIVTALNQLQSAGFVILYTATVSHREVNLIQVVNFKEHQDCHVNEQPSILPEYKPVTEIKHCTSTVQALVEHSGDTPSTLTYTSTLTLDVEEVVVDAQKKSEKQIEFEGYVTEFDKNNNASQPESAYIPDPEKEKSCAKKEKVLPTIEEAKGKVSEFAWWRNVIEHLLKPEDVEDLTPEVELELEKERDKQFKIFYEQKEDFYKIRYPTSSDMAQNFYNWVSSRQRMNIIKPLLGITNANTTNTNTGTAFRKRTDEARDELIDLRNKSREFLRKTGTDIHTPPFSG